MVFCHINSNPNKDKTFNPSSWEAEADKSLHLSLLWSTKQIPGEPELHRATVLGKTSEQTESDKYV